MTNNVYAPNEPIRDEEQTTPVNHTPGCIYEPGGVGCKPEDRHCGNCGWNPAIARARIQKLYPGYLATLEPMDPSRKEALLNGNWGGPDNG